MVSFIVHVEGHRFVGMFIRLICAICQNCPAGAGRVGRFLPSSPVNSVRT